MADVAENLIALLKTDSSVNKWAGGRFHEDHVPQDVYRGGDTLPFVWVGIRQETQHGTLGDTNGSSSAEETIVEIECVAGRQNSQKSLASAVATKLRDYRGTFGDTTTKGIILRDKDNDYVPKATGGDNGLFVSAFDAQVWL